MDPMNEETIRTRLIEQLQSAADVLRQCGMIYTAAECEQVIEEAIAVAALIARKKA